MVSITISHRIPFGARVVALSEKLSTVQHAWLQSIGNEELMHECFPTLEHGNSKNGIRQRNRRRLEGRPEYGNK